MSGFAAGVDLAGLRLAGLVLAAWQRKRALSLFAAPPSDVAIRLASVKCDLLGFV